MCLVQDDVDFEKAEEHISVEVGKAASDDAKWLASCATDVPRPPTGSFSSGQKIDTVSPPSFTGNNGRKVFNDASMSKFLAEPLMPTTRAFFGMWPPGTFITPSAQADNTSRSRTLLSTQIRVVGSVLPGTPQQMANTVLLGLNTACTLDMAVCCDFRLLSLELWPRGSTADAPGAASVAIARQRHWQPHFLVSTCSW